MSEDDDLKAPGYFTGNKHKEQRRKSMKQEDRVAKRVGGYRQKASGALPGNRGDVKGVELLGECKRTDKKSISITLAYLEKITHEAVAYDKIPAVAIEFGNTPKMVSRDWVMVPADFMQDLLEAYRGGSN
jgi:hypothetical protein